MASLFSLPAALNPPLVGRAAVVDAMYRCVTSFDLADAALFDSSFMPDGVMEINGQPMKGRDQIHAMGLALLFKLDTTHLVGNVRVHLGAGTEETATEASLTASVISQHYALGKGLEPGQKQLMGGNVYRGELVKDTDGLWKFKHMQIKGVWTQGDYSVMTGSAGEHEK